MIDQRITHRDVERLNALTPAYKPAGSGEAVGVDAIWRHGCQRRNDLDATKIHERVANEIATANGNGGTDSDGLSIAERVDNVVNGRQAERHDEDSALVVRDRQRRSRRALRLDEHDRRLIPGGRTVMRLNCHPQLRHVLDGHGLRRDANLFDLIGQFRRHECVERRQHCAGDAGESVRRIPSRVRIGVSCNICIA